MPRCPAQPQEPRHWEGLDVENGLGQAQDQTRKCAACWLLLQGSSTEDSLVDNQCQNNRMNGWETRPWPLPHTTHRNGLKVEHRSKYRRQTRNIEGPLGEKNLLSQVRQVFLEAKGAGPEERTDEVSSEFKTPGLQDIIKKTKGAIHGLGGEKICIYT